MNGPESLAKWFSDTGTSQAALATAVGCSGGAVSLWLSGGRSPGGKAAFAIQQATGGAVPAEVWFPQGSKGKRAHPRRVARTRQ